MLRRGDTPLRRYEGQRVPLADLAVPCKQRIWQCVNKFQSTMLPASRPYSPQQWIILHAKLWLIAGYYLATASPPAHQ